MKIHYIIIFKPSSTEVRNVIKEVYDDTSGVLHYEIAFLSRKINRLLIKPEIFSFWEYKIYPVNNSCTHIKI